MIVPMSLRTFSCEVHYQYAKRRGKTRPLEEVDSIIEFNHWRIIPNEYCYCGAYKVSHILLPLRPVPNYGDLDSFELAELAAIHSKELNYIDSHYDLMQENMNGRRSVHNHFHYHLLAYYPERKRMNVKTLALVGYIVIFRAWLRNLKKQ